MDETKNKVSLGHSATQNNGTGTPLQSGQIVDLPSVSKNISSPPSSPSRSLKSSLASIPQFPYVSTLRDPEQQTSIMEIQPQTNSTSKDAYRLLTDAMPFREKVVGDDSRRAESFVPVDTHHFNEKDFQDHRDRSYPHMHAPLKSLKTTPREKVKTKHKQPKKKDREVNDTGQEIIPSRSRRQKHGHPRPQSEGFKPSLNIVNEINHDEDHSSSTISNDEQTNVTPTPQDIETNHSESIQPNRGNFYAAFASENPSASFLETLNYTNSQPTLGHDALDANLKMNASQPKWGSDLGRVNSMGQTLPNIIEGQPFEVPLPEGKISGDRKVSFGQRPTLPGVKGDKRADFELGISSEDLQQNAQTTAEPVHRHHSREYFSPKDLQQRQFSGDELRQLSEHPKRDLKEEGTSVGDEIISHRTGEYRGIRQHKIQPHAYSMRRSTSYDSRMHYDTMNDSVSSNRMYGPRKFSTNVKKPSLPSIHDTMLISKCEPIIHVSQSSSETSFN
jgi:hypothetical protein